MVYDPREGIRAKQVFCSFVDTAYNTSNNASVSHTGFTGTAFGNFWSAYYGDDMTINSVDYSMLDLGFPSGAAGASVTQVWEALGDVYDTIASISGTTITLTSSGNFPTVTTHVGRYFVIKAAAGNADLVYGRITANNTAAGGTIDTDLDLDPATSHYDVAAADTIILLDVPFGLTMDSFHRLDHIATDFELEPPKTETEDTYFMGAEDSAGSQNMNVDENPPTKMIGTITIRGGIQDLMRMKYQQDTTVPTGTKRYNLGSETTTKVGFHALWTTDVSDTDATTAVTKGVFCNDIVVTNVGILDTVNADGRAEATVEFEAKGKNCRMEVFETQADDTSVNQ